MSCLYNPNDYSQMKGCIVKYWVKFKERVKDVFNKALKSNSSPSKLALSFCIGVYIAFSPFPGAHTIMMLAAQWLFKLNFPILFFATALNNPWTAIPFFIVDYSFGYWFVHSLLGLDPVWAISLKRFLGMGEVCLWSFLVGGNLLGIGSALLSYPVMTRIFKRLRGEAK